MRPRFTLEDARLIRAEYEAGASGYALAAKWGGCRSAVLNAVRRGGGHIRTLQEANRENVLALVAGQRVLTDDEAARAAGQYADGLSIGSIAKRWGISESCAWRYVRREGVVMRAHTRTHPIDESVFDSAESNPAASYFAGLIFADGCVSIRAPKRTNEVLLALKASDIALVEAFRSFLRSGHAITVSDNRHGYPTLERRASISIPSNRLVAALAKYNIVPRKSLTAVAPVCMLANRDWWRGCVDGDGWVSVADGRALVGLTGSRDTCDSFAAYVRLLTPTAAQVGRNGSVWKFSVTGSHAVRVLRALYEGATVALDRKAAAAKAILERLPHRGSTGASD